MARLNPHLEIYNVVVKGSVKFRRLSLISCTRWKHSWTRGIPLFNVLVLWKQCVRFILGLLILRPWPWLNDQSLFIKHLRYCFTSNVWQFGDVAKHCSARQILSAVFEKLKNHTMLVSSKMFDKQCFWYGQTVGRVGHCVWLVNLKCLSNNVWSFGQDLKAIWRRGNKIH